MAGGVSSPDQDEQKVTDEERAAAARAFDRSTAWSWSDKELDQVDKMGDIIKTETNMPSEQRTPSEIAETLTYEVVEQKLRDILSSSELPAKEELKEITHEALAILSTEPPMIREQDREQMPGGIVSLRKDADTLIIPDIHARREFLAKAMLQQDESGKTNLRKMMDGELQVVCMGNGMHSITESQRWYDAEKEAASNFTQSPSMDAEMTDSLGVMQMVIELKKASPVGFHYLKGCEDNITNSDKNGSHPYGNFVNEGELVARWMEEKYGSDTLEAYEQFEAQLPIVAVGEDFAVSNAEPSHSFVKDKIVNFSILEANPMVRQAFTMTNDGEVRGSPVDGNLKELLGREDVSNGYWFGNKWFSLDSAYLPRQEGKYIQVNSGNELFVTYIPKGEPINPDEQILSVKNVDLQETPIPSLIVTPPTPTPLIVPTSLSVPLAAAVPPRVEPVAAAPRVEPTSPRVESAKSAARVIAPEAAAEVPTLTAAEQELAKRLMEQYQQKFVPEESAEPYFGERGSKVEQIPTAEKRDFANIFQEEMHATMVKNARDIEMGRKTAEEIATGMTKEEIFFTYFSVPEHIETRQDLVGLGHSLTLLMEKRLAAYYGVSKYNFGDEFQDGTQKEKDIAFLKELVKERNEHPDKLAEIREINELFWIRFGVDRRLRGEKYEEGAMRRRELEFEAIKDDLNRFARWRMGRRVERTGEYESFVAAFDNELARNYLDGILKRRMDEMGIAVAAAPEAVPVAVETAETSENMVALGEIADYLAKDEGMGFLLKALQEIARTKTELSDKDYVKSMFDKLNWKINDRFVGEMANSVAEVRKNPKTASARQQGWSIFLALIQIFVSELGNQRR